MHHGGSGGSRRRCHRALMAGALLSLIGAPAALGDEWEKMRGKYDNTLRVHEKRIAEIEAKERGGSADQEARAVKITRDRVTGIRAALKGGGKGRSLADTAERASSDARALVDLNREQSGYLAIVTREWGAAGAERKSLRDAMATLQQSFQDIDANLARAAEATTAPVQQSGVLEKAARTEVAASEAGERLRARWQREQAAREREREQREREAAERARGMR
jgi:hypothetical protein